MKFIHMALLFLIIIVMLLSGCATTGLGGAYSAQQQVVNAEKIGEKLYVACRKLPLHNAPDGYSATKTLLSFGTQVEILEAVKYYQPDPDKPKRIPAWAKVTTLNREGYVASRCLVNQSLFEQQNAIDSAGRAKAGFSQQASKGFSEEEEGDLFMMMGGTGKAKGGAANYSVIDQYLTTSQEYNPQESYMLFRQEGKLGEFQ